MKNILIQLSDRDWTVQATHLACALARISQADVVLLRLDFVRHPGYLGADFDHTPISGAEAALIATCTAVAGQYGVSLRAESVQCVTGWGALVAAAEQLSADTLFAPIPATWGQHWRSFQTWRLTRRLSAVGCRLFTLGRPAQAIDRPPSIAVVPPHSPAGK